MILFQNNFFPNQKIALILYQDAEYTSKCILF